MNAHHHHHLDAIFEAPEDLARWLDYADWLEEQGDERTELIRLRKKLPTCGPGPERIKWLMREKELVARCNQTWLVLLERADWRLRYLALDPKGRCRERWKPEMQTAIGKALREFETAWNLRLPRSYKAYTHVFDYGEMARTFRIAVPVSGRADGELGTYNRDLTSWSKEPWCGPREWLQQAIFFCSTSGGEMVAWDTKTITDPIAHEYRVCWLDREELIQREVRSFPEFIDEICLGAFNGVGGATSQTFRPY